MSPISNIPLDAKYGVSFNSVVKLFTSNKNTEPRLSVLTIRKIQAVLHFRMGRVYQSDIFMGSEVNAFIPKNQGFLLVFKSIDIYIYKKFNLLQTNVLFS